MNKQRYWINCNGNCESYDNKKQTPVRQGLNEREALVREKLNKK